MNQPKQTIKEPLLNKHSKFQELCDKASRQLEVLSKHIDTLEVCKSELTKRDKEKAARKKMREVAAQVNKMINQITEIFKELKVLKFSDEKDKENRKKTLTRLRGYFSRQHDRFTQSLSTYQEKEKFYIAQRVSLLSGGSSTSILSEASRKYFESISDPGIDQALADIDYYQAILEERDNNLHIIRGIAYEMRLQAEDQAKALQGNQEDLEMMLADASVAEKQVEEGHDVLEEIEKVGKKKRFDGACKRNVAICLLVVIICGIVLIATLATHVIKI